MGTKRLSSDHEKGRVFFLIRVDFEFFSRYIEVLPPDQTTERREMERMFCALMHWHRMESTRTVIKRALESSDTSIRRLDTGFEVIFKRFMIMR